MGFAGVAAGLFVTWAIHDAEEAGNLARSSGEVFARAPGWLPIPERWRREGYSQAEVNVGLGLTAVIVGAASVAGARSGGRSVLFRTVLLGYGLHGFGHLAASAATRGYTAGVATAPLVVIPYWLWARRRLIGRGVAPESPAVVAAAALGTAPMMVGTMAVSRWLVERARSRSSGDRV